MNKISDERLKEYSAYPQVWGQMAAELLDARETIKKLTEDSKLRANPDDYVKDDHFYRMWAEKAGLKQEYKNSELAFWLRSYAHAIEHITALMKEIGGMDV